jgi:hypothetical protein
MSDHGAWEDHPRSGLTKGFEPGESNGTVIRLSVTAALDEFLFGSDNAVINGAVKAIGTKFSASSACSASLCPGLEVRP